jgi:hypothetical protein
VKVLNDAIAARKAGDRLRVKTLRGEVQIDLAAAPQWSFAIHPVENADALQTAILADWMRLAGPRP